MKDNEGALLVHVIPGGPADKAGIEQENVMIAFDGKIASIREISPTS